MTTAAPAPKAKNEKTDFADDKGRPAKPPTRANQGRAGQGAAPQAPPDRPESSSGDEQTTSGGS